MIHTARQLKALVRNMSNGDSAKAQVIIRSYAMERFLERVSLSQYQSNLILKGGTLIASIVGIDTRSTMDIDATIKNIPLSEDGAMKIVQEITAIKLEDGITFHVKNATTIMDEADYAGVRAMLDAELETMRIPLKIDFSTGDVITPREITYEFKLLFEERTIPILAYNLETILAEKLETLLSRGTANTRMRDFYDIYVLTKTQAQNIHPDILHSALLKTGQKRGSSAVLDNADMILVEIENSASMISLWKSYQRKYDYAANIEWSDAMRAVKALYSSIA